MTIVALNSLLSIYKEMCEYLLMIRKMKVGS